MEGESTSGVLSGFVLGALTFHHLNTDSDTVSRARLPTPPSLPAVPARPVGSRTRAPSFALIRALSLCSRLDVKESSPGPPPGEESPAAFLPRYPAVRGIPAPLPTRSAPAPLEPGGRARAS